VDRIFRENRTKKDYHRIYQMEPTETSKPEKEIARNEPCPCGSGRKYKRCHGVAAAPKLSTPAQAQTMPNMEGGAGGMPQLPEGFNNEMMVQMAQMFQRLPKGQLQRLQSIMQRAMSGKDVTREAAEFEKTLPVEFQSMLQGMAGMAGMAGAAGGSPAAALPEATTDTPSITEDEARKIVAEAAESGRLSKEEADKLLAAENQAKSGGIGKFFGFGKK
jgi:hypothetical protein